MGIAKFEVCVDEIADRLDAPPSARRRAEQLPRDVTQPIGLAIAATIKVAKNLRRQVSYLCFLSVWLKDLWLSIAREDCVTADARVPRGRHKTENFVAKVIDEDIRCEVRRGTKRTTPDDVGIIIGMRVEETKHLSGFRAPERQVVAEADEHEVRRGGRHIKGHGAPPPRRRPSDMWRSAPLCSPSYKPEGALRPDRMMHIVVRRHLHTPPSPPA